VSGSLTSNSIERFDGTNGAFVEVFVSPGSGGLDFPTQFIFVPEPGSTAGALVAVVGLAAAARRRRS
jgi:MYXO-CTERM domain-containing protein